MPQVDMSGLAPKTRVRAGPLAVGDVMRTRQGRLYMLIAVPDPLKPWSYVGGRIWYVGLDRDGNFSTGGGTLLEYAEANWELAGHVPFSLGEPEWYL